MVEDDSENDADDERSTTKASTSKSIPLLEKIRTTLAKTAAEKWEVGGEELDSKRRHQKPQEFWEELFCTPIKSGVLVMRRSTPLSNNFATGGYTYTVSSDPIYTIEVRPRGWSSRALLDPSLRGAASADKNCKVLVEGRTAKQLFEEVQKLVQRYREQLKRNFHDAVERLMANVHEQISSTAADDWKPLEGVGKGVKGYSADVNGIIVTVTHTVMDLVSSYGLRLSQHDMAWECRDPVLVKQVYDFIDESISIASLEQLDKALEDLV